LSDASVPIFSFGSYFFSVLTSLSFLLHNTSFEHPSMHFFSFKQQFSFFWQGSLCSVFFLQQFLSTYRSFVITIFSLDFSSAIFSFGFSSAFFYSMTVSFFGTASLEISAVFLVSESLELVASGLVSIALFCFIFLCLLYNSNIRAFIHFEVKI